MSPPVRRVAVFGSGLAAWMSAALLAGRLPATMDVIVVDTDTVDGGCEDAGGRVEVTLPSIRGFHAQLGLSDEILVENGLAVPNLAVHYPEVDLYLPFEAPGFLLDRQPFHHFLARLWNCGSTVPVDRFALAACAARSNRHRFSSEDPTSLLSGLSQGLQLDVERYARVVREVALARGVQALSGPIAEVDARGEEVRAVVLAGGERVSADLYLDVTGGEARLLSAVGGSFVPLESARGLAALPGESGLAKEASRVASSVSCDPDGWTLSASTPGRRHWRKLLWSDDEVASPMGCCKTPWRGNVIALGETASRLESFVTGPLHWVQAGVIRLLEAFPSTSDWLKTRHDYNRRTCLEWDDRRAFFELHLFLATLARPDSRHWRERWAKVDNPGLSHRLMLFQKTGVIAAEECLALPECLKTTLMLGHGVKPESWDPQVAAKPLPWIEAQLGKMQDVMARAAASLPAYRP